MNPERDWQACAGRHLLAHILKAAKRGHYYCHPSDTARPYRTPRHPESFELARILRSYAHCWALDMAEWPGAPPSAAEQREAWAKAMECAERECRAARA